MRSLTDLEIALVLEDVGDLGDALDEHERAHLAERVVQRVKHGEEEDRGRGDARGDVAQDVDLRAARAARAVLQDDGHAAGLQRRAHRATHVDVGVAAVTARLHPLRGQPPAQLRDDAVHGREVGERTGGQRSVEVAERSRGRKVAGALDLRALELRAQQRLEAPQRLARESLATGSSSPGSSGWGSARRPSARRIRCTSTPITPEPSWRRAKAAIAIRARSRIAPSEPSRIAAAICARSASSSSSESSSRSIAPDGRSSRMSSRTRRDLHRAEEEAVEDELEHAPVLLALGERRGERLAEVALGAPVDLAQYVERVDHLRGADRDPFAAQLLAELENASGQSASAPTSAAGDLSFSPRARRRHPCRCGA